MTDKEKIMIDGIQFNEFGDFYVDYDLNGKFQSISSSAKEYKILKSLIKQLARKTQECEELKQYQEDAEKVLKNILDNFDKMENRYRKALEEIEEVIKSPCAEDCVYYESSRCYDCIKTSILDIIRKAKGEE